MIRNITILLLLSLVTLGWGQDCDEGYTYILDIPEIVTVLDNSNCFYQSDLDVLQQFIDNSQEGENPPPSDLLPIELGEQVWEEGRLVELCSSHYQYSDCSMDYEISGEIHQEVLYKPLYPTLI